MLLHELVENTLKDMEGYIGDIEFNVPIKPDNFGGEIEVFKRGQIEHRHVPYVKFSVNIEPQSKAPDNDTEPPIYDRSTDPTLLARKEPNQ